MLAYARYATHRIYNLSLGDIIFQYRTGSYINYRTSTVIRKGSNITKRMEIESQSNTLLRLHLEEEIHSTQKLHDSQREILEFLKENSDHEIEEAYKENNEILVRKTLLIKELHNKLMIQGISSLHSIEIPTLII